MSHFVVMVIGDDVEKQLAPFHEFECTGIDDEYVVDVDVTESVRAHVASEWSIEDAVAYEIGDDKIVSDEDEIDLAGAHKYGFAIVKDGVLVRAVNRTNPNKKWDWWVAGGRWTGFFRRRSGATAPTFPPYARYVRAEERAEIDKRRTGKADSCRWGDVDVEVMKADAETEARAKFAKWRECFDLHGRPESWPTLRARLGVEPAREAYRVQPAIAAYREVDVWGEPDAFGFDEDAYVTRMVRKAVAPFAFVLNGEWIARGSMGWFACVSNEKSDDEWLDSVERILASIEPNTLVTVVDCHI